MVRFVRKTSDDCSQIDLDTQRCIIDEKNQRHLNIQYLRGNSGGGLAGLFFGSREMYLFNFTYDKTNPQLWYATFQPCSASSANKTDYFPITTTAQEFLSSKDALLTLTTELAPVATSFRDSSLMAYLLKNMFMPDGTTNLPKLEQLHQYAQQTIFCNVQPSSPLYRHALYPFFDLLASQVSLADSAGGGNIPLILAYMQIIHATKDNPELLQQAINQEGAVVDNIFNLDKIKSSLQIPSMQAGLVNAVLPTELYTILKEYADKRIHNAAMAHQWLNVANKQHHDALAHKHFFNRACLALAIVNVILMSAAFGVFVATALPYLLLPWAVFAVGAIVSAFVRYKAQPALSAVIFLSRLEKGVAERSLDDNYSITQTQQSFSTVYMQQACRAFEEKITIKTTHVADSQKSSAPTHSPRPTSLPEFETSGLSIFANKSSDSSGDSHYLGQTSPSFVK
jgi:hypothetical protein